MRRTIRPLLSALILGFAAPPAPTRAEADLTLTFGVHSSDKPSAMFRQLRPTLNLIERSVAADLGEPVEIKLEVVRGYAGGAALLLSGRADAIGLAPASYVQVRDEHAGIELLSVEYKNRANAFEGVIAMHQDGDLTDISQLRGQTFAFGSERSTLGRYFAQLELTRVGNLASDLKPFEYLGRHDKVGQAVGAGLFDAGALEVTMFKKLRAKGVPIRAIHTREALTALRFDGFRPGRGSDYDPIREAIPRNPDFFKSGS